MTAGEQAILVLGTIGLLVFSWWFSIRARRFHGLYRLLALESILVLALLNWRYWFVAPFSFHQILSWLLLCGSIVPAIAGFRLLSAVGTPQGQFENTTRLVTVGVYKFIRHPLYASLIMLGIGIFFKHPSSLGGVCACVDVVAILGTALCEEKEMIQKFGEEYITYMKVTKMFIPYFF